MTHVLVCFGIEGISQAVMAAGVKKTFNNLAGRSKTLVFLALNVLRVEGQSPVERGGLRCFTAFLGFSAIQEFEEIAGVQVVVPVARAVLKVLIVADHALARVLRHVVRPVVLACADALVFVIKRVVNPVARLVGRATRWSYGVVAKAADACFDAILAPAGRAVKRLWSRCGAFLMNRVAYPTARAARRRRARRGRALRECRGGRRVRPRGRQAPPVADECGAVSHRRDSL